MTEPLSAAIARRYLISKKSHSAVGAISAVSVCAMAVATAAIICVLSVFNGFRKEIGARLDTLAPDVMVTPAKGKVFGNADSLCGIVARIPGVKLATPTLTDNALAIYASREMPVTLKGVNPEEYTKVTSAGRLLQDDSRWFSGNNPEIPEAVISIGTASQLGAQPSADMLLFTPRRKGRVNLANPAMSFVSDSVAINGVYRTDQQEYDENGVIVSIATARRLLQYTDEASAIEVKAAAGTDHSALADRIASTLGNSFTAKDRLRQQEMNFRMVSIEKWVSFLLLFFILAIASFNLISSLSMLVLEKESSLSTLVALGMSKRRIGAVFAWESIYVSLIGGLSGVLLGVLLCIGQMRFGWISIHRDMDGSMPYPVELQWGDVAVTLIPVLAIGIVTAIVTSGFARKRC